ncbi:hypothetical protein LEP1GSC047_4413 [Leptospira inadai serovar Lyme str. 10]|uniref:Uncharacterized protein n=3 Tax=Leptospira inadai TaxID=29506 RepID=V6HEP6_9LEPT|nr:hypothetical protein LEP1GSC047_4413 [Leptospira inadai serovar Lyme str. 10]PNV73994.1 hypothetical protein BES34_015665 [Leptospira inadai serovar Lyme]
MLIRCKIYSLWDMNRFVLKLRNSLWRSLAFLALCVLSFGSRGILAVDLNELVYSSEDLKLPYWEVLESEQITKAAFPLPELKLKSRSFDSPPEMSFVAEWEPLEKDLGMEALDAIRFLHSHLKDPGRGSGSSQSGKKEPKQATSPIGALFWSASSSQTSSFFGSKGVLFAFSQASQNLRSLLTVSSLLAFYFARSFQEFLRYLSLRTHSPPIFSRNLF